MTQPCLYSIRPLTCNERPSCACAIAIYLFLEFDSVPCFRVLDLTDTLNSLRARMSFYTVQRAFASRISAIDLRLLADKSSKPLPAQMPDFPFLLARACLFYTVRVVRNLCNPPESITRIRKLIRGSLSHPYYSYKAFDSSFIPPRPCLVVISFHRVISGRPSLMMNPSCPILITLQPSSRTICSCMHACSSP